MPIPLFCYTMLKKISVFLVLINLTKISESIRIPVNDKDLPIDSIQNDELDRRRRPSSSGCNFYNKRKPVYKTDGSGRTFLDLAFVNVGYNYAYNIHCGEGGGGGGHYPINNNYDVNESEGDINQYHKPGMGGHNKPGLGGHHQPGLGGHHPPGLGGHHKPGLGHRPGLGQQGGIQNRPILSMLLANRPFQNIFSQSNSQQPNQPSVINNIATSISGIFPSPQELGQGFGDGISSFVQTLPQIGQSFQSLLPNFENFQWPQFGGAQIVPNAPVRPAVQTTQVTAVPVVPNDEIKPVHEDYDPITDPYKLRLRYDPFPRPGQYLIASHPLLGTNAFHLSSFDPAKFYQELAGEVEDFFGDLFNY